LLTGTFVTDKELNTILEENMRILEDNPAVRVLEDRGIKIGIQQGIQKGIQKGIQQGIQRGVQRGIQQRDIQIVINMLQAGEDYSKISLFTGLDSDRIAEIDKQRQV